MADDILQRVYRAFDPLAPLAANDTERYVDLDTVRGSTGFTKRLAKPILNLDSPTCQVVTGHRGSGKSTELRRLQCYLEESPKKLFVVYCEADADIDRNDVDFPEILIALIRQMADQLRKRAGIVLKPGYFKDRFEQLKGLFGSTVSLEEFEVDTGLLKVSGAIKNSPDARKKVRAALEPDTSNLLHAANDLIGQAKIELGRKGYGGLAVIVDDLDKMVLRPCEKAACSTCEYLYIHREAQLQGFECHVVYTMPIACAYSSMAAKIESLYGRVPPVVPMTKITTRPPTAKPYEPGIVAFREIIDRRLAAIGVDPSQVFADNSVRDAIIGLSGGQPLVLMALVREGLMTMPITREAVDRAEAEDRRAYARILFSEHWPVIQKVRESGSLPRDKKHEEAIRELLDSRAILQYVNSEEWYGVNPFIAEPHKTAASSNPKPKGKRKK